MIGYFVTIRANSSADAVASVEILFILNGQDVHLRFTRDAETPNPYVEKSVGHFVADLAIAMGQRILVSTDQPEDTDDLNRTDYRMIVTCDDRGRRVHEVRVYVNFGDREICAQAVQGEVRMFSSVEYDPFSTGFNLFESAKLIAQSVFA